MAPLLAIPTALSHAMWLSSSSRAELAAVLFAYSCVIAAIVTAARHSVPRFMQLLVNPERALAPQVRPQSVPMPPQCTTLSLCPRIIVNVLSHPS